jgi:hypothetical protein
MEGKEEDGMRNHNPSMMANRELFTEYERSDKSGQYFLVEEMTKRLGWKMITKDVVPVFKQYKLNGAGDKYN